MLKYIILFACIGNVFSFDYIKMLSTLIHSKRFPGNTECVRQLNIFKDDLLNGSNWAIQMFDASGKTHSGLMNGNFIELGQFDQCMNVNSMERNIRGKYCLARMRFSNVEKIVNHFGFYLPRNELLQKLRNNSVVGLVWGICMPDGCSGEEATNLTNNYIDFSEFVCQTAADYPKATTIDYFSLSFFIILFGLIVASTLYDIYTKEESKKRLFISFSFLTNGKKLLQMRTDANLSIVDGMRSISVFWIIIGHMYSHLYAWGIINTLELFKFTSRRVSMIIISGHMAVDTFLFLSGLLVTCSFLKAKTTNFTRYYFHRYCRLTPALAIMILLHVTLIKFALHGPLSSVGNDMYVKSCERYWWSTLLYMQNWINPEDLCVPISWYLSVDMQLYVFAPLILIPLKKYPKRTLIVTSLLAFASALITFCVVWIYKIEALFNLFLQKDAPFTKQYYYQTYTRATPWCIGVIVGYYLYQTKFVQKSVNISKKMVLFLWTLCLGIILMCVFGGHELLIQEEFDPIPNCFYLAFVKLFWSIALGWIVYACETGNGGPINWFLSLNIFKIFATLSYSMYLLHYTLFGIMLFNKRHTTVFSNAGAIYDFCGHFVLITAFGVLWYLSFERPFIQLELYLTDKLFKTKLPKKNK